MPGRNSSRQPPLAGRPPRCRCISRFGMSAAVNQRQHLVASCRPALLCAIQRGLSGTSSRPMMKMGTGHGIRGQHPAPMVAKRNITATIAERQARPPRSPIVGYRHRPPRIPRRRDFGDEHREKRPMPTPRRRRPETEEIELQHVGGRHDPIEPTANSNPAKTRVGLHEQMDLWREKQRSWKTIQEVHVWSYRSMVKMATSSAEMPQFKNIR